MTTDAKPAAAPAEAAAKTFVAFFTTPEDKGPKVELFKNMSVKPRAPLFDGKIDGVKVSAFLRKGPKGNFLGLAGDKDEATGLSADLGAANVGTRQNGIPVLVIDLKKADGTKQTVFASISKKVDNEMLVNLGMNVEKQAEKRATAAAKAAAKAAPAAAAPKP